MYISEERKAKKQEEKRQTVRLLSMISQFGINMLVPICMMTALGIWLDRKFGTVWITIALFFAGAVAGGQNVYRMAKGFFKEHEDSGEHEETK